MRADRARDPRSAAGATMSHDAGSRGPAAAIVLLLLAGLSPGGPVRAAEGDAASLVGTWRIEKITDTDASGRVHHPYGERPKGYIVYDPTGHVHVQIMRTPPTPPFASGDDAKGTDAEVRAAYQGYVAYFGTYSVDARNGTLVHHVEGSLMPSYTATDQPRPFVIRGDELRIEGDSDGIHFLRQLRRVK
jgi:hypothetical protein